MPCIDWCVADDDYLTGDPVSSMASQLSGAPAYTQATVGQRPARVTIGDKTWLRGTAAALTWLRCSAIASTSPQMTVAMLISFKAAGSVMTFSRGANGPHGLFVGAVEQSVTKPAPHNLEGVHTVAVGLYNSAYTSTALSVDTPYTLLSIHDLNAGAGVPGDEIVMLAVDGVSQPRVGYFGSTGAVTNFGSLTHDLFSRAGGLGCDMDYRAHAVWDGALTAEDMALATAYFASLV